MRYRNISRSIIKIVFQYSAGEYSADYSCLLLLDYKTSWERRIPGVGVLACAHIIISIIILIKALPTVRNNTLHVMRALLIRSGIWSNMRDISCARRAQSSRRILLALLRIKSAIKTHVRHLQYGICIVLQAYVIYRSVVSRNKKRAWFTQAFSWILLSILCTRALFCFVYRTFYFSLFIYDYVQLIAINFSYFFIFYLMLRSSCCAIFRRSVYIKKYI